MTPIDQIKALRAYRATRIDLGLAILSLHPVPPGGRQQDEIAAFCDCSREYIGQIERRALRKIAEVAPWLNPSLTRCNGKTSDL